MPQLTAHARLALKSLLSAGLIAAVAAFMDIASFRDKLQGIRWPLVLAAIAINVALQVVNAWKVRLLFPAPAPGMGGLVRVNCISNFFNTFVPGGVGGELARWVYLTQASGSRSRSLAVILVDRVTGLWSQILLVLLAWLWLARGGPAFFAALPASVIIVAASLWAGLAGYRMAARGIEKAGAWLARRRGRVQDEPEGIGEALSDLFAARGRFLAVLALSVVYQAGIVAAFLALDRSIGDGLPWEAAVLVLFGHTLITLLPIALGNWGLSEGSLGILYRYAGFASETGVLVSLLLRVMQLPVAAAGWVLWLRGRKDVRP